jgi:hypothetical protein
VGTGALISHEILPDYTGCFWIRPIKNNYAVYKGTVSLIIAPSKSGSSGYTTCPIGRGAQDWPGFEDVDISLKGDLILRQGTIFYCECQGMAARRESLPSGAPIRIDTTGILRRKGPTI